MGRFTVLNKVENRDERIKDVNPDNLAILEEYIEYLQSIDRSDDTILKYINNIENFFIYLLDNAKNKNFVDFNKRDMIKYQNFLMNKQGLGSSRIRTIRSSLSSMSNFIENIMDEDYPNFRNIINKIPAPTKTLVRKKTVLSDEQVESLLSTLIEKEQYQAACLFALAASSGARKAELLRFRVDYFKDEYIKFGSLYKTPEKMKTKGRGKQGKQLHRYVLVKEFKPYFDMWMKEREEKGINSGWLFLNLRGGECKVAKSSFIEYWVDKASEILGIDMYIHSLRHYFTTHLSQSGVPPQVIQEIIGWESVDMVTLYDDTEIDDKLGDFFSEDGIVAQEKKSLSDL